MSISRVQRGGLQVAEELDQLVANQAIPGSGVDLDGFWASFEACLNELGPVNKQLLRVRDEMQEKLDAWHLERKGQVFNEVEYKEFLQAIGYLLPEPEGVKIDVANVDVEIASIAGPQLVVPVMNARYALNAANARWGSLYDAFYIVVKRRKHRRPSNGSEA